MLTLDAINFGSGWFPTLRKRAGRSGYFTIACALTEHVPARGSRGRNERLRAIDTPTTAAVLRPGPGARADGALRAGAARPRVLPGPAHGARDGSPPPRARPSAWPRSLAAGMPFFDDRGFYKRAQIVAERPGARRRGAVRRPRPADDLRRQPRPPRPARGRRPGLRRAARRPHRRRGAPRARRRGARDPRLRGARLRADRRPGSASRRGCSTSGCGTAARPRYKALPRHRTRTVFY